MRPRLRHRKQAPMGARPAAAIAPPERYEQATPWRQAGRSGAHSVKNVDAVEGETCQHHNSASTGMHVWPSILLCVHTAVYMYAKPRVVGSLRGSALDCRRQDQPSQAASLRWSPRSCSAVSSNLIKVRWLGCFVTDCSRQLAILRGNISLRPSCLPCDTKMRQCRCRNVSMSWRMSVRACCCSAILLFC